ncbi:MarR family transcriptional regulator [Shimia thalassica]|uniref:MarR family winged helix-turn-helix transcriptional regulator n=1 Tax=Shimia thalassica TaxID=1715693 RepID=UPI002732C548|nr:MarR family transcriptional regulator [Shimia thalassica]MDP2582089.1 MarR family transcriptional regulator [Shimia thalassica]
MTAGVELSELLLKSLPALDRQVSRELAYALRPHRVSQAQYLIIDLLLQKGNLPPRKISEALSLDQSTVVSTLTRMERDGLIQRLEDPSDGRSVLIHLTARSQKLAQDCECTITQVLQGYADKLSDAEKDSLGLLLKKLLG